MARQGQVKRTSFAKGDGRIAERRKAIGARGQMRRDMTMLLVQKLNEAEKNRDRSKMEKIIDNLVDRAMYAGEVLNEKGKVIVPARGDMEAIKYIFDRLEGRPAQQLNVSKDSHVQIEFRSYEEIKIGLLERGVDIERMTPELSDLRDDGQH